MAPVILHSKAQKDTLIIGGSGGSMITTAMATTLINYLYFDKSLKDSVAEPVVYVDGKNALKFEANFDKEVIEELKGLHHTVEDTKIFYNVSGFGVERFVLDNVRSVPSGGEGNQTYALKAPSQEVPTGGGSEYAA
ncbi:hypothetical protein NFI96_009076 [Prochilodus magdalenae]|nr:hypothetical protein NFI96_009076 [Prochilodus magdalenae]